MSKRRANKKSSRKSASKARKVRVAQQANKKNPSESYTLPGSSKKDGINDVFVKFRSDDALITRCSEIYDKYCKLPEFKKIIDEINQGLRKYAGTGTTLADVPDYCGYNEYIYNTYETNQASGNTFRFTEFEYLNDEDILEIINNSGQADKQNEVHMFPYVYAHFIKELDKKVEKLESTPNWKPEKNDLQDWNIYKLLTAILRKDLNYTLQLPLHNPRRIDSNISIFKRFISDEKYIMFVSKMYEDDCHIPDRRKIIDKIYENLKKYVGVSVPDYFGYKEFIYQTYIAKIRDFSKASVKFLGQSGKDCQSFWNSLNTYVFPELFAYLYNNLKSKSRQKDWKPTQDDLQNKNFLKLLISEFMGDLGYTLDILMSAVDSDNVKYLDDNIENLNVRALLGRFFKAVDKREQSVCYKILGRAQALLDPGESDYLEAVIHFYDQEYDDAIHYTSRVIEGDPDYPSAVSLLLECYAQKGDMLKLTEYLKFNKTLKFFYYQLLYLLQETILNDEHFEEETEEKYSGFIKQSLKSLKKSISTGSEYYVQSVTATVKCIIDVYTELRNLNYYPNNDTINLHNDRSYNALIVVCVGFQWAQLDKFVSKLDECPKTISDDWLRELRKQAMYVIGILTGITAKVTFGDNQFISNDLILLGFESLYKLDMLTFFTDSVNRSIDYFIKEYSIAPNERLANIILLAYTEESIQGNLNEKVKEFVDAKLKGKLDESSIVHKQVGRSLSTKGAIALEAAETQYSLSKTIDWGWKDAGMLSLAYYRIIEVEINQKLLLPAVRSIGIDRIQKDYETVRSSLTGESKKSYVNKWGRIISTLDRILSGTADVAGLMLGEMEYLFRNIGSGVTDGDLLAQSFRRGIGSLLVEGTDLDEFVAFLEKDVVNKEIRDKYRNPPAHTRYLPYKTACECRDYFYQLMQHFQSLLRSRTTSL